MVRRQQAESDHPRFGMAKFVLGEWEIEFHIAERGASSVWRTLCGAEESRPVAPTITPRKGVITTSCPTCFQWAELHRVPHPVGKYGKLRLSLIEAAVAHPHPQRRREMAKSIYIARKKIYDDPDIIERTAEALISVAARRAVARKRKRNRL